MYHPNVITARKAYDAMDPARKAILTEWIRYELKTRHNANPAWPSPALKMLFESECKIEVTEQEFRGGMWDMCFHIKDPDSKVWFYGVKNSSPAIMRHLR